MQSTRVLLSSSASAANKCASKCTTQQVDARREIYGTLPLVIRNYAAHADCDALSTVLTVPLGSRTRLKTEQLQRQLRWRDVAERRLAWSFSSARPNAARNAMVDAAVSLLSALPHHLYYPHRRHKLGHDGNLWMQGRMAGA